MEENADVAAALEMLPTSEKNLRMFRLRRATDLSLKHAILPQDQWTKPEEVSRETSYTLVVYTRVLYSFE